ncbi:MAG: response regulator [Proteobacteria bacterium]|nr:response regulator [Pseudomonadota bacterium]
MKTADMKRLIIHRAKKGVASGLPDVHLNPYTLAFEGEYAHLENPFLQSHSLYYANQTRIAGVVALLLYLAFGIVDALWAPGHKAGLWFVRYAVFGPILLGVLVFCYSPWFKWEHLQIIISFVITTSGISIIIMTIIVAPKPYNLGLIFVVFVNFTCLGARFIWATLSGLILFMAFTSSLAVLGMSYALILVHAFFSMALLVTGMFASYSIEANERSNFLLAHLLEMKHESIRSENVDLEKRVLERTAALAQAYEKLKREMEERQEAEKRRETLEEELRRAGEMKAIARLAGRVAHDFNNFLMGIQGYASIMLLTTPAGDENFERAERIQRLVDSAARLARQLLGVARGGRYDARPSDLNDLIVKSATMFGETQRGVEIVRDLAPDPWPVLADRTQMEQVFLNLFINASQAMSGKGLIRIVTQNRSFPQDGSPPGSLENGDYVQASVSDSGVGMDEACLSQIFDPFFTTKEGTRGSGLGLASAHGIITNHGGAITVKSRPGQGACFDLFLPRSMKKVALDALPDPEPVRGRGLILFVDDDEDILSTGSELLSSLGYEVICRLDGAGALEVFGEKHAGIDLVILDMIMPEMTGPQVYRRMKDIQPGVRVLIASGYGLEGEEAGAMKEECEGFIQKPFNIQVLSRKLQEILVRPEPPPATREGQTE